MTPEEEKIVAHNMHVYIQAILRSQINGGNYWISPTPVHEKYVREIVAESKIYANEIGKRAFEAARKIGNPQDGSVAFWTYEEYLNSADYHANKTH